MDDVRSLVFL